MHLPTLLDEARLAGFEDALGDVAPDLAGARLFGRPALARWLEAESAVARAASAALGAPAFPVRAILFDKTEAANWALGWHQDRTIAVRARRDLNGFGPWTRKGGVVHVAPPITLLDAMATVRIHLDAVPETNAPLLVAVGSHRLGAILECDIDAIVARSEIVTCLAERGDLWIYSTPILHASKAASTPMRRRVLQVDYATAPLPPPLEWLGVG